MKKIIVILIVAASTVFAAKEPLVFAPDFEGFLGKYTQGEIHSMVTTYKTNYPYRSNVTVVVINGTTAKDTLQITRLDNYDYSLVLKSPIKAIKSKKYGSTLFNIELPGSVKTQIKLPEFMVFQVIANDLKILQCLELRAGVTIKNSINGVNAKFDIVYNHNDSPAVFSGKFKALSSKYFKCNICACDMYAPAGKFVKLKAKTAMHPSKLFHVNPSQVKFLKKPDKNGYLFKNINVRIIHI